MASTNKRVSVGDEEGTENIDTVCVPMNKGLSLTEIRKAKIKEQEVEIEKLKLEKMEQQVEIERLKRELKDKDEALEHSQELNNVLMLKEHEHNDELQQIRKLLICAIGESSSQRGVVRLRLMGELDRKPFLEAVKDKFNSSSQEQASSHSDNLCSFWEGLLKDVTWHPFRVTLVDGKQKELLDEEDAFLKSLKNEWGEKVYAAFVNALVELNEYNPSGRRPVQELWDIKQEKRATLIEGVSSALSRRKKRPTTTTTTTSTTKRPTITQTATAGTASLLEK